MKRMGQLPICKAMTMYSRRRSSEISPPKPPCAHLCLPSRSLFRLDAGVLDHLAPLAELDLDEVVELSGRVRNASTLHEIWNARARGLGFRRSSSWHRWAVRGDDRARARHSSSTGSASPRIPQCSS